MDDVTTNSSEDTAPERRGTPWLPQHRIAAAALIVGGIAIAAAVAWRQKQHAPHPAAPPTAASASASVAAAPQAPAPLTIGAIDAPAGEAVASTALHVSGWALAPDGIGGVEVRVDGRAYPARYGIARADVAQMKPGFPDTSAPGFAFDGEFAAL